MEINNQKKVITCGINTGNDSLFDYEMKELENLCDAIGFLCVGSCYQNLENPTAKYYFGSGKVVEIGDLARSLDADYIIINDEISPVQLKNISDLTAIACLDRTMLILEIFKNRATTKEANLQVDIAKLNYMLPRLIGGYTNLSKVSGSSSGGGYNSKGSGETQIELDRRAIHKRIDKLKKELSEITLNRQTSRKSRKENEIKTVALVGYTNSGKSSTLNAILDTYDSVEEKQVFTKDMLFATLDTSTRRIKLDNNYEFLITDTVGFVSKLPHHLIESFKSTLEEIKEADLILHVVDASSPYSVLQIETTNKVLQDLGVKDIPMVYLYNKIDKVKNKSLIDTLYEPLIFTSVKTNEGIDKLIDTIIDYLRTEFCTVSLLIPFDQGQIYNAIKEKAKVIETEFRESGIYVKCNISKYLNNLYSSYIID